MKSIHFDGREYQPSKIVCIGQNYVEHIRELGNEIPSQPVIFIKPNSAISGSVCTHEVDPVHHEGEIAFVVIGGELAGVGFGLDLTKREIQTGLRKKGLPWERSKAFDGSAVFSEFVSTGGDLVNLRLELWINGRLAQQGGYDLMMNKPWAILDEVGSFLTFEDGDVIMTGTPKGVGPINTGDTMTGKIFAGQELLVQDSWVVR